MNYYPQCNKTVDLCLCMVRDKVGRNGLKLEKF